MPSQGDPQDRERGVVPFPRPGGGPGGSGAPDPASQKQAEPRAAAEERSDGEADDRHRMVTNVVALFVVALLVSGGLWLALSIADLRKNQDCALSGRRNCAQIERPSADRW